VLTPQEQQRKEEVDQYLADQYADYYIYEATQGYSGDIYYWVDPNTIPGSSLTPPPAPWTAEDLIPPAGAELGYGELELYPELRGPDWTIPIHRPDFWEYVGGATTAISLQDYLQNYQVSGKPGGPNRLYAGLISNIPNNGASGNINQFQGDVELGTFSLIEIAVVCPAPKDGPMVEQIGVVISRDRATFGDAQTRVHVEYLTQGGAGYGEHWRGGWDERQKGFIAYPHRQIAPGQVVPGSVPGSATETQKEYRVDIFQSSSGDWWIALNGKALGYYPADLFARLNSGACAAAWYGEVFDPTPADWTWTDMGGSEFASAGWGYASYIRDPTFHEGVFGPWYAADCFDLNPLACEMGPVNAACYTRSELTIGLPPWGRYFYLGGPGGDAPGCD
jgi:hypothetical protein